MKKKVLSFALAAAMVASLLSACGGGSGSGAASSEPASAPAEESVSTAASEEESVAEATESAAETGESVAEEGAVEPLDFAAVDAMEYEDASEAVYMYNLGDFYDLYMEAKSEVDNNSIRFAKLAQASAKLEEQAVMIPMTADGGNYAISRLIPRSDTQVSWGVDEYRYGYTMVTDHLLTSEDRTELVGLWNDAETEADYYAAARDWLEQKGYSLVDSYDQGINGEGPQTWDVLATSRAADSRYIAPTYSPLLRYDGKSTQQPGLAESYEVSEDGLTYTFHLRNDAVWVDQQGREIAPVTADDWVAGMQHTADYPDELGYLLSADGGCGIVNFDEYVSGEITDFSQVGVAAVDDYTLQYTLTQKCPFFLTMLGYGCFAPLCRTYFESQGGAFGAEFDPSSADYVYGTDPGHIAYCGEFLITNYTQGSVIRYEANPTFWDADNLNVHSLSYIWYDATDVLASYHNVVDGTFSGAGLNASAVEQAKLDTVPDSDGTYFDTYGYVSATGATSYVGFYNLNRAAFANVNDDTKMVSSQTEEDAARTRAAMNNVHFRRALTFGVDRGAMNAPVVGEELKLASVINSYVPGNFVQLTEDVTMVMGQDADGNDVEQTFAAGTYFGEIMQAQFDFDGFPVQVWDPAGDDGAGSSGGFDGWYNVDNAKAELAVAIEELAAQGVEISADNPIYIDYPYWQSNENYANKANVYKQSLEASFDGEVVVNLVGGEQEDWYYCGYYTNSGAEANYDMYDLSGWGPDYRDPATFLDTFLPYGSGYMAKCIGVF